MLNSLQSQIRKTQKRMKRERHAVGLSALAEGCADSQPAKTLTVCGPYANRDKWRLVLLDGNERKSVVLATREEAEQLKERMLDEARARSGLTIGKSLDEYRDYRIKYRGVKPATAEEHCQHLRRLLPLTLPISSLTVEKARRLYLKYAGRPNMHNGKPLSPNTHHWVLLIAKCWGKWCVKTGLLTRSPFATVEPIGKCNAGKQQLRVDEAHRFSQVVVERAHAGDTAAVGVLLMLHLGLRQGEVSARVVRDVDADGTILHIPFGKTDGSRRRLKIPEWLRPLLLPLVSEKGPTELLFTADGSPRRRSYWWRKVHAFCELARVPLVCPHSLRGLHATLAIEEGSTSEAVARALGHSSFAMTAKHYASADSVANARVARAGQVLAPKEAPMPATEPSGMDAVAALLARLTPEQLADLKHRLSA